MKNNWQKMNNSALVTAVDGGMFVRGCVLIADPAQKMSAFCQSFKYKDKF